VKKKWFLLIFLLMLFLLVLPASAQTPTPTALPIDCPDYPPPNDLELLSSAWQYQCAHCLAIAPVQSSTPDRTSTFTPTYTRTPTYTPSPGATWTPTVTVTPGGFPSVPGGENLAVYLVDTKTVDHFSNTQFAVNEDTLPELFNDVVDYELVGFFWISQRVGLGATADVPYRITSQPGGSGELWMPHATLQVLGKVGCADVEIYEGSYDTLCDDIFDNPLYLGDPTYDPYEGFQMHDAARQVIMGPGVRAFTDLAAIWGYPYYLNIGFEYLHCSGSCTEPANFDELQGQITLYIVVRYNAPTAASTATFTPSYTPSATNTPTSTPSSGYIADYDFTAASWASAGWKFRTGSYPSGTGGGVPQDFGQYVPGVGYKPRDLYNCFTPSSCSIFRALQVFLPYPNTSMGVLTIDYWITVFSTPTTTNYHNVYNCTTNNSNCNNQTLRRFETAPLSSGQDTIYANFNGYYGMLWVLWGEGTIAAPPDGDWALTRVRITGESGSSPFPTATVTPSPTATYTYTPAAPTIVATFTRTPTRTPTPTGTLNSGGYCSDYVWRSTPTPIVATATLTPAFNATGTMSVLQTSTTNPTWEQTATAVVIGLTDTPIAMTATSDAATSVVASATFGLTLTSDANATGTAVAPTTATWAAGDATNAAIATLVSAATANATVVAGMATLVAMPTGSPAGDNPYETGTEGGLGNSYDGMDNPDGGGTSVYMDFRPGPAQCGKLFGGHVGLLGIVEFDVPEVVLCVRYVEVPRVRLFGVMLPILEALLIMPVMYIYRLLYDFANS